MERTVRVLGTHGVPAGYGGFETAAQNVGLYLAERGWRVVIYCQTQGVGPWHEDRWGDLERVIIPVDVPGWRGTAKFDLLSIRHAVRHRDVCLTFGYNTAVLNVAQRLLGIRNVINMDGIEWSRSRWGLARQSILYINERIACLVGDHLIADHPEIRKHLLTRAPERKVTTITYGAHAVTGADPGPVVSRGLVPGKYVSVICRPIPENSILEIVRGFSARTRGYQLAVLGQYEPERDRYHRHVMAASSDEVVFLGPLYAEGDVRALRFHSAAYLHGHTVGGTNPSLVEAMAAGNAVIAHDNPYNRWVAQDGARYFTTAEDIDRILSDTLADTSILRDLGTANRQRHATEFTWEHVAAQYEELLRKQRPAPSVRSRTST